MSTAMKTAKPTHLALQVSGELSEKDLEGVSGGLSVAGFMTGTDEHGPEALGADPLAAVGDVADTAMAAANTVVALTEVGSVAAPGDTLASRPAGASAGISVESKDETEEDYEGNLEAVSRHAPEFENTGRTQILLGVTTDNGRTTAVAGFTAGASEVSDAGNGVTMTTKYTVAAIAQAYHTSTSAGAGAMVGTGVSASFALGQGVTFDASAQTVAKAGIGGGIVGNNLVIDGGVSATVSAIAEIAAESETLDDAGTTARGETSWSAGAQAVASGEGSIGANGVSGDYGASVGAYVKADGEAELGNDSAAMTIGGGVITPGSVSAGISGGATVEDGKLTLSFGSEFAFLFGGVSVSFSLDIQLIDGTKTVGTAEEISEKEQEALDHARGYDQALTAEWRATLTADANAADKEVDAAALQVSQARVAIEQYDEGVKTKIAWFNETQARIDQGREALANQSDPAKRAEELATLDKDEADLEQRVALFEERMSSPAEAARRQTMFDDFRAAQSRLDVVQGFADGVHKQLDVANSMTYMQFQTVFSTMAQVAQVQFDAAKEVAELARLQATEELTVCEREQTTITERLANVDALTKGMLDTEKSIWIEDNITRPQANIDRTIAELNNRVETSNSDLNRASEKLSQINNYIDKYHPLGSAATNQVFTSNLAGDLQKSYDSLPQSASDGDRRALFGALEGAKAIEQLARDNVDRIIDFQSTHDAKLVVLNKELDILRTEVTVPGLFSEIARLFGG